MGDFAFTKMNSSTLLMAVIVATIVAASRVAEGQQNVPSCATKLVPCASYLNSTTKPPASCCDPLKEAVTKELSCLCNLYNTPGLLKSFGINVTQAIGLPALCGIPGDQSACPGTGKGAGSSKNSSSPSSSTPASVQPKNNAGTTASTGIFSFLLIWTSVMFI